MNTHDKNNNIRDLQVWFQPYVEYFISLLKIGKEMTGTLSEGFRSCERQDYLYRQGRSEKGQIVTNAKCNQSDHQFGRAIDIVFTDYFGVPSWSPIWYREAAKIAKPIGFKWGGDWLRFKDYAHFYMDEPPVNKDFIAKWKGSIILDVQKEGQLYYIDLMGKRHYLNPHSLDTIKDLAKIAVGMRHIDVLKFPEA